MKADLRRFLARCRHKATVGIGLMFLLLCCSCDHEMKEPPLEPPPPVGADVALFQQRQIAQAHAEAAMHTVAAEQEESGSQQQGQNLGVPNLSGPGMGTGTGFLGGGSAPTIVP